MSDETFELTARLFRALGNSSRLRLLDALRNESLSVSELAATTGLAQPLVSQYLKTLREVGVVSPRRSGRESRYEVADAHIAHIVADAHTHVAEDHIRQDSPGEEER